MAERCLLIFLVRISLRLRLWVRFRQKKAAQLPERLGSFFNTE